jgi:hypothetical protein
MSWKKERSSKIFIEKDILGQEKPQTNIAKSIAKPGRIFIGLAIFIVAILIYMIYTNR